MERRVSGFKKILEDYDFKENATENLMPRKVRRMKHKKNLAINSE
jgi:hypothetical protein